MVSRTRKAAEILMYVLVIGLLFLLWRDRFWREDFLGLVQKRLWKYSGIAAKNC
jgi:hypothetical protein